MVSPSDLYGERLRCLNETVLIRQIPILSILILPATD
jgi:hypothetical protein